MNKATHYIKQHPAISSAIVASGLAVGYVLFMVGTAAFFLYAIPVDDEDDGWS